MSRVLKVNDPEGYARVATHRMSGDLSGRIYPRSVLPWFDSMELTTTLYVALSQRVRLGNVSPDGVQRLNGGGGESTPWESVVKLIRYSLVLLETGGLGRKGRSQPGEP